MSTRFRFALLRLLPWLMGLTIGAAIIYLQKAGIVRGDREVLLQIPRTLPKGYDGTLGARAFVYEAADSGDPRLLTPTATLWLRSPNGKETRAHFAASAVGGLEATVALPAPIDERGISVVFEFELGEEKHELFADLGISSQEQVVAEEQRTVSDMAKADRCPVSEDPSAACHASLLRFTARFGGCVAGRPCPNAHDDMKPWPEDKWSKLKDVHALPRYAVAIDKWLVTGSPGEAVARAELELKSDTPIAIDRYVDGVWNHAGSRGGTGPYQVRADHVQRYQFRPDPFDVGAASVFVFDPSDPGPSAETLAKQEATVFTMPQMWSWNTQRKREAVLRAKNAKFFFVAVIVACAMGAIALLVLRWKSTRPRAGAFAEEDEHLLMGRTVVLVAGVFAFVLLFMLATALYLMRDFLGF